MVKKTNKSYPIEVADLTKEFKLPHERSSSLKSTILNFNKQSYETFCALSDVSFHVKKGEFFGILGRNGSGKSTLLKLLAGIYTPTKGSVRVEGALTPFIELGVGFNPELTGRENVYLNGVILGLTEDEINEKYDEIVAFAELERFMDQKLKNYSSGMQVRLAFSIAIQAHNSILLIDEVLAVGDERFQNKCLGVFNRIKKDSNRTVVFVSHDMGSVQRFCDRAIVIHDSKLIFEGDAQDAVYEYKKLNFPEQLEAGTLEKQRWGDQSVCIEQIKQNKLAAANSNDIHITMEIKVNDLNMQGKRVICGLGFSGSDGVYIAGPNSQDMKQQLVARDSTVEFYVKDHRFNSGQYDITAVLQDADGNTLDHRDKVMKLSVARKTKEVGTTIMGGEWKQRG